MPKSPETYLPLKPNWFHVLLSLAAGEQHGYGIMQEVLERTGGKVRLWPATLYGTIKRLIDEELIEESAERPAPKLDDARRRYYRLTRLGRRVLAAESGRPGRSGSRDSCETRRSGEKDGTMKAVSLRLYRALARVFPCEFKNAYGDQLLQVTEEAVELIWRRQGVLGLARLLLDIAIRVPIEHASELRRDIRYGLRALAHSRGFTIAKRRNMLRIQGFTTNWVRTEKSRRANCGP